MSPFIKIVIQTGVATCCIIKTSTAYYDSDSEIHVKYSCKGRIKVSDFLKDWQTKKYTDIVSAVNQPVLMI